MSTSSCSEWFHQYLYQPTPTTVLGDPTTTTTSISMIPAPPPKSSSSSSSSGITRVGALQSPRQESRVSKPTTRKRARASRKNPTTLLSTDTSNFRAMVQMYTGGVHQGQMRNFNQPGGSPMLGLNYPSHTILSAPSAAAAHLQQRLLLHNATAAPTFFSTDPNNNNINASSARSMAADSDHAAPCGPATWTTF